MGLPKVEPRRSEVKLPDGQTVEVRGLTRTEFHALQQSAGDLLEAEALTIAAATGVAVEEAREWLRVTPGDATEAVMQGIAELSGMGDGPKASNPQSMTDGSTDSTSS